MDYFTKLFIRNSETRLLALRNTSADLQLPRGGARNFRRGADSSDEGAKIWFSEYFKFQKIAFHLPTGASILRRGAIAPSPPLAPPLQLPKKRTSNGQKCFSHKGVKSWNCFSLEIKQASSLKVFKAKQK